MVACGDYNKKPEIDNAKLKPDLYLKILDLVRSKLVVLLR